MSDLENLYQDVILDHAREKHGYGLTGPVAAQSHQVNPTCGDEITLGVATDSEGRIARIVWEGQGCSISTASASLLTDLVENYATPGPESVGDSSSVGNSEALLHAIHVFRDLLRSRGTGEPDADVLGDAVALAGVSRYVTRVKCAMLPWVALEDALNRLAASAMSQD